MLDVEIERMKAGICKFNGARQRSTASSPCEAELMCTMRTIELSRARRMAKIHPTAIVEPGAELDADGRGRPLRGRSAPHVRIGAGTTVGAALRDRGPHDDRPRQPDLPVRARSARVPQDKKYAGEPTELEIGDRNTIREFCTFNLGTAQDAGVTRIGDDNWIMAYVHIAHDCQVGNQHDPRQQRDAGRPRARRRLGRSSAG